MSKQATKIEPQAWYTLQEIARQSMFPWLGTSYWSVRRVVLRDLDGKNHLRTVTMGKGTNVRYQIKGERITKFIQAVEAGKIRL